MTSSAHAIIAIAPKRAYLNWIRQYILFRGKRHPAEMGAAESVNSSLISQSNERLRDAKGNKDRVTILPATAADA